MQTRTADPDAAACAGRFDLGVLEFDAVRGLLMARLATPLGRHAVDALGPAADAAAAALRLREVQELAQRMAESSADTVPLAGVSDLRSWLWGFFAGEHQLGGRDLAEVRRLVRASERCRRWLVPAAEIPGVASALATLGGRLPDLANLAGELELVVDDRGEILSTASAKLAEVRREIDAAQAAVRAAVQRFLADSGVHRYLQTPEPAWRHGRPVFQVRQEHRQHVAGVLHDRSASGATLFIEPPIVVEAANRLSDARAAEHREVQVVIAHVGRGLRRCRPELERSVALLAQLDLRGAAARLMRDLGFTVPAVADDGILRLQGARHPILVARDGADAVVALDVALGDPHHLLVVTGPNTGGKTVVLKTIGLLALMAQSGVPIPAAVGSRLPWFDGVFADIGDEQGIDQNLSTFSSHVTRIARCLGNATARSLVLLDELGAGTDPEEGGALGYAVLELLERRGVRAVVTTHLGRLKDFAYQHTGAENGSMAFDGETLRPLYRLEVGIPGASHALDVAAHVGMPRALVARARELLGRRDTTVEEAVQRVQVARREAELDRRRSARAAREVELTEADLREQRTELERRQMWLHEEADALVDEQIRGARDAVREAGKQLRNAPKPFGPLAGELVEQLEAALRETAIHRRRMRFVGSLRRDSVVYCPRLARRATVRKVDRVRELCTVEVGKMRLEVAFEDVSWLQPLDAG